MWVGSAEPAAGAFSWIAYPSYGACRRFARGLRSWISMKGNTEKIHPQELGKTTECQWTDRRETCVEVNTLASEADLALVRINFDVLYLQSIQISLCIKKMNFTKSQKYASLFLLQLFGVLLCRTKPSFLLRTKSYIALNVTIDLIKRTFVYWMQWAKLI